MSGSGCTTTTATVPCRGHVGWIVCARTAHHTSSRSQIHTDTSCDCSRRSFVFVPCTLDKAWFATCTRYAFVRSETTAAACVARRCASCRGIGSLHDPNLRGRMTLGRWMSEVMFTLTFEMSVVDHQRPYVPRNKIYTDDQSD